MIIARQGQTLEEHLKLSLKAFEELKSTRFWKLISEAEEILKIAIVFHDAGKIFYQIENNIKNKNKEPSFLGHEFFSAFILDNFTWAMKLDKKSKLLATGSVLYHHYAMGLKERLKNFERKNQEFRIFDSEKEFEGVLEEHKKIVLNLLKLEDAEKAMDEVNNRIKSYLNANSLDYHSIFNQLRELNNQIWEKFVGEKDFRKLMLPCINTVTIVDYLGVNEGRSGFRSIVEEFMKVSQKRSIPSMINY